MSTTTRTGAAPPSSGMSNAFMATFAGTLEQVLKDINGRPEAGTDILSVDMTELHLAPRSQFQKLIGPFKGSPPGTRFN